MPIIVNMPAIGRWEGGGKEGTMAPSYTMAWHGTPHSCFSPQYACLWLPSTCCILLPNLCSLLSSMLSVACLAWLLYGAGRKQLTLLYICTNSPSSPYLCVSQREGQSPACHHRQWQLTTKTPYTPAVAHAFCPHPSAFPSSFSSLHATLCTLNINMPGCAPGGRVQHMYVNTCVCVCGRHGDSGVPSTGRRRRVGMPEVVAA